MGTVTWEELGAASLARQFPDLPGRDAAAVAEVVRRIGPIQSQTARSPYLGLGARMPGVTHAEVTQSYESFGIVRGSTIRGTVHTCVPEQHALMEVATRIGQRTHWLRSLKLDSAQVDELWSSTEDFARGQWRTPAELLGHLEEWVGDHGGALPEGAGSGLARYLGFGHGGLVRRPLNGRWDGQGAPGYRTAAALLPGDRARVLADPRALDDLLRVHLRAHGPASRQDLSWWSGLNLGVVDEVLARLDLDGTRGPDGRDYLDLPDPPEPVSLTGVRFLPEFDALMCGYHPTARQRFMTVAHGARLWNLNNGLVLPPLLVDGRITGYWRAPGSARRRPLEVTWFAGTRKPRKAELDAPVAALESALAIDITEVTIRREAA